MYSSGLSNNARKCIDPYTKTTEDEHIRLFANMLVDIIDHFDDYNFEEAIDLIEAARLLLQLQSNLGTEHPEILTVILYALAHYMPGAKILYDITPDDFR